MAQRLGRLGPGARDADDAYVGLSFQQSDEAFSEQSRFVDQALVCVAVLSVVSRGATARAEVTGG